MGLAAAALAVAVVIQVARAGSEKKSLEDDQLCTDNMARARERIAASKLDEARDHVSAAKLACGTKRAAEYAALRGEFDAAEEAANNAQVQANTALVKEHRDAAARVWNAYDNLPAAKKSKLDLMTAMSEAKSHEQGLPPALVPYVTAYNEKETRVRMAPLINPASRAEGSRGEILVPSPDRAACILFGSSWSKEVDSLQAIGFEQIRCNESTYRSQLTGEMVTEPARVWTIPKP